MIKRREFITLVGGTAMAWPVKARAQRSTKPVIAVLGSGAANATSSTVQMELLDTSMHEVGLTQGRDYVYETRWGDSDSSRVAALAAELVALRPNAIVVSTNLAAITVQKLSRSVPIVGLSLNAPIATGLVASLAHPGGNITGVSTMADDLFLKLVEIMREALPEVRKLTIMINPTNPSNPLMLDTLMRHFANKDLTIGSVAVGSPADLDAAFVEISRQHPGALFVLTDNSLLGLADKIVAQAMAQQLPTFGSMTYGLPQAGALFNYGRDTKESFHAAARILKKIINGASPNDIPVEQPTKYTLAINLKTAKTLGITVPPTLLARADEVIE